MSSVKKTALLGLNQWNLLDRPRMADFNFDNNQLEAAWKAHTESDLHLPPDRAAWLAEPAVSGSYTGSGGANQTVTLGFRPALLLVFAQGYGPVEIDTAADVPQLRFAMGAGAFGTTGLTLTDTGFTVIQTQTNPPPGISKVCLNQSGVTYHYFAMK